MKRLTVLVALGLLLTGCSSQVDQRQSQTSESTTTTQAPAPDAIITLPALESVSSDLGVSPLTFVTDGKFTNLTVLETEKLLAVTKATENTWTLSGVLKPGVKYSGHAIAVNNDGKETKTPFSFTTVTPKKTVSPTIYPLDNDTVGIGMPITLNFKEKVTDKARVEKLLKVNAVPVTEGSWGWMHNDTHIIWKPTSGFWKPGTKVTVEAPLEGANFGGGKFGKRSLTTEFTIGRSRVIHVDDNTKSLTVEDDGVKTKTFPVSLGKPGKLTSSGLNIVYEKGNPVRMRGDDYDQMVNWAMRYNTTGEYLHSAPWSVGDQGRRNVSHGCVNIAPNNAKWLYQSTLMGDVVSITGTGRQAAKWDGMGALWNYSAAEWDSLSALK